MENSDKELETQKDESSKCKYWEVTEECKNCLYQNLCRMKAFNSRQDED